MAEILIGNTDNIDARIAEKDQALGNNIGLWLKKGPKGECLLRVVPCKIETTCDSWKDSDGEDKISIKQKIRFNPEKFDLHGINIVEDVFVEIRKHVNKAIFFSRQQEKGKDGHIVEVFKLETLDTYLPSGSVSRFGRSVPLSDEMKESLVQKATDELIDFLFKHLESKMYDVIIKSEAYCRREFC